MQEALFCQALGLAAPWAVKRVALDVECSRIDLYVADAEPNLGPQIDALFGWPGNNCLSSAVRNVLQHCNPRGSNVYTYFVRTN